MPGCRSRVAWFSGCFFNDFLCHYRYTEPAKTLFLLRKNKVFAGSSLSNFGLILLDFWCQFASIFHQKSTQIRKKSDPRRCQHFHRRFLRFFSDFGCLLGAMWEPCWPPERPQGAPGRRRDAPKTPQDALRTVQERPRTAVRQPKKPQETPGRLQDRFLDDFSSILNRFSIDFSSIFHGLS